MALDPDTGKLLSKSLVDSDHVGGLSWLNPAGLLGGGGALLGIGGTGARAGECVIGFAAHLGWLHRAGCDPWGCAVRVGVPASERLLSARVSVRGCVNGFGPTPVHVRSSAEAGVGLVVCRANAAAARQAVYWIGRGRQKHTAIGGIRWWREGSCRGRREGRDWPGFSDRVVVLSESSFQGRAQGSVRPFPVAGSCVSASSRKRGNPSPLVPRCNAPLSAPAAHSKRHSAHLEAFAGPAHRTR